MKFQIIAALVCFVTIQVAQAKSVVVGVLTRESHATFEEKLKPLFQKVSDRCKSCQIRNLTPYDSKGNYDSSRLIEVIENVEDDISFLYFDWNEKFSEKSKALVQALSRQASKGRLIVASAGVPMENEAACPLSRTMMGQVTDTLIVGELTERDRLLPMCYYGPEMLSAFRPPKHLLNQGYVSLIFAAKLAENWNRRKPSEWVSHLRARKQKSKRLWPDMNDFLPN